MALIALLPIADTQAVHGTDHIHGAPGGRFETMASTRDTRMVMIVDSEPAQQRFLSALVSRGG